MAAAETATCPLPEEEWSWREDDKSSWTPFLLACESGDPDVVSDFLKKQPDCIKETSSRGKNALHIAACYADVKTLEVLLEAHPHLLESRDEEGFTPLLESIKNLNTDNTKYLLKKGADATAVNKKQQNIFQIAAVAKNLEIFKLLIK